MISNTKSDYSKSILLLISSIKANMNRWIKNAQYMILTFAGGGIVHFLGIVQ